MNHSPAPHVEWERELATLLNDLSDVQQDLLEVLEAKRDSMAAGDLESMARLQPREQALGQRLQECHERRQQLLAAAVHDGAQFSNLQQLANVVDSGRGGGLRRQVKDAVARMRLLQHASLTNWVLAQRSLLHLAQMLEIIANGGRLQPTYGKDRAHEPRGALVDQEA